MNKYVPLVKEKIDCDKNLCINPKPIIIFMAYVLGGLGVLGAIFACIHIFFNLRTFKVESTN